MDAQLELATYWTDKKPQGRRSRELTVPDQQVALVQRRQGVQVLAPPGPYHLLGAWDAFLGRDVPPVWLMTQGPIALQPLVTNLLSYDGQIMEADTLVQARIADPVRVWQEWVTGQTSLNVRQVEGELGRRLQPVLSKHVHQFLPDALQHQPQPVEEIQRAILPSLRALLEGWGFELLAVTHLGVRPALDVVAIRRQRQAIEQKLADLRLEAQIGELENAKILQQAKDDIDLGLTEADVVRVQVLTEQENAVVALTQVLEDRLARLEGLVKDRLDQLAGAQAAQAAPPATPAVAPHNHTVERLEDWVSVLRLLGSLFALLAAASLIFFPQVFPDRRGLELAAVSIGFLAALLAFVASWLVHREVHRHRSRATARVEQAEQTAEREARGAQEQGIRRYLEQRLRQVSSNCQQTWQRVYERDLELATGMRKHCANAYSVLADEVMAADYPTSAYLSSVRVPADDLAQMLLLSQGVLDDAQAMVDLSQGLYQAAIAGDLETVRRGATRLDEGRLAIENRFTERERFILSQ